MVKIKSEADIKSAYREGATRAPGRYKDAVARTSGVIAAAIAAEDLYAQKVQEAIAEGSRVKGLQRSSDEQWRSAAVGIGASRIGPGMTANVDKQSRNFAPFREAIANLELPARVADPIANVDNRVKKVVETMVNTKKGL